MSANILVSEGRRLQRDSSILHKAAPNAKVIARWYEPNYEIIDETNERLWLGIHASVLPTFKKNDARILLVYTNEENCQKGRVELADEFPDGEYDELSISTHTCIAPLGIVCRLGNSKVEEWLKSEGQDRNLREGYGAKDHPTCIYDDIWFEEYPLYKPDGRYAMIGGWHWPCADHDWDDLIDSTLLIQTIQDSEPWIEVFKSNESLFSVIQRHT